MVGVADGTSIGTISKKSFASAFEVFPALVTFARISDVNAFLPELKKQTVGKC